MGGRTAFGWDTRLELESRLTKGWRPLRSGGLGLKAGGVIPVGEDLGEAVDGDTESELGAATKEGPSEADRRGLFATPYLQGVEESV